MKRLILLGGVSLLSIVSFSQEVSGTRSAVVKPVENKEANPVQVLSDSVAIVHSMARDGKSVTVPVTKQPEINSGKQPEKATITSSARKPD